MKTYIGWTYQTPPHFSVTCLQETKAKNNAREEYHICQTQHKQEVSNRNEEQRQSLTKD